MHNSSMLNTKRGNPERHNSGGHEPQQHQAQGEQNHQALNPGDTNSQDGESPEDAHSRRTAPAMPTLPRSRPHSRRAQGDRAQGLDQHRHSRTTPIQPCHIGIAQGDDAITLRGPATTRGHYTSASPSSHSGRPRTRQDGHISASLGHHDRSVPIPQSPSRPHHRLTPNHQQKARTTPVVIQLVTRTGGGEQSHALPESPSRAHVP